jgi:hypothetical protein
MNPPGFHEDQAGHASHEEIMSALFAHMVMQQSNMALMMMGRVPHPQSGQVIQDLEAAKMFIDQLEMLAHKTRGNLSKEEDQLLQQSLTSLRLGFVEQIEAGEGEDRGPTSAGPGQLRETEPDRISGAGPVGGPAAVEPAAPRVDPGSVAPSAPAAEESRKKFTKKY